MQSAYLNDYKNYIYIYIYIYIYVCVCVCNYLRSNNQPFTNSLQFCSLMILIRMHKKHHGKSTIQRIKKTLKYSSSKKKK